MTNEEAIKIITKCVCNNSDACLGVLCEDCAIYKAITELEKQIPIFCDPQTVIYDKELGMYYAFCPSCNELLFKSDEFDGGCRYCRNCGHALKWGKDEDD